MPGNRRISIVAAVVSLVLAACAPATTEPTDQTTEPQVSTTAHMHDDDTAVTSTLPGGEGHMDDHQDDADHEGSTDGDHEDPAGDVRTVEVIMTEFAFAPSSVDVLAGETVRFLVINDGAIPHEFRLSNAHRIEEHLASGHEGHDDGGHHNEGEGDVFIVLDPGTTAEMTFTFPVDTTIYTDIACLIEGHHEAGMHGKLSYQEA